MGGLLVTKNTPADGVIAGMEMCTHAPYKAHIAGYSPGSNVVQHNQKKIKRMRNWLMSQT